MLRQSQILIAALGLVCASAADLCVGFSGGGVIAGKGSRYRPRAKRRTPVSRSTASSREAYSVASPALAALIARATPSSSTTHTTIVFPTRAQVAAILRADSAVFS
jgi:hypothetical protein